VRPRLKVLTAMPANNGGCPWTSSGVRRAGLILSGRQVDGHNQSASGLENCYRCKPIQGSNPCPSAKFRIRIDRIHCFQRAGVSMECCRLTANLTAKFADPVSTDQPFTEALENFRRGSLFAWIGSGLA